MNMPNKKARLIAFYLPQYHPTTENDLWWGKGFTEWTNVASAKPLFKGHEQPVIPGELSFYDLRLQETRIAQARLAKEYGIEGFCYWHYWFNGKQMLERPFNEVLSLGEPTLPFCLGWANHSWSGVWKDEPHRILMEQTYPGEEDDINHFNYLVKAFKDNRYITIDGKPILVIFKPNDMPDAKKRFDLWRNLALQAGLKGLFIIGNNILDYNNPKELGLDAIIVSTLGRVNMKNAVLNLLSRIFWAGKRRLNIGPQVIRYSEAIKFLTPNLKEFETEAFPCVYPNWDNTPRKGRKGQVLLGSTPELFEKHLNNAMEAVNERENEHKLIFVKSWNEWAEGNFLEPSVKWGRQYLEVIRKLINK